MNQLTREVNFNFRFRISKLSMWINENKGNDVRKFILHWEVVEHTFISCTQEAKAGRSL